MFESLFVAQSVVSNTRAIVVDGCEGVVEELGNLRAISLSHANEGEDAEFGGEQFASLGHNGRLGFEQRVELLDEIGIEGEEELVEVSVELRLLFFDEVG